MGLFQSFLKFRCGAAAGLMSIGFESFANAQLVWDVTQHEIEPAANQRWVKASLAYTKTGDFSQTPKLAKPTSRPLAFRTICYYLQMKPSAFHQKRELPLKCLF